MKIRGKITQSILDRQEHEIKIHHGSKIHTVTCKDHLIRRVKSPAEAYRIGEEHLDEVMPNREQGYIVFEKRR